MQDEFLFNELNEECGIFGIVGYPDASKIVYYGLHALQHRGQESAGIVSSNKEKFYVHKGTGLVTEVFNKESLERFCGNVAVGHVRYSTCGGTGLTNAQPLVFRYKNGEIAIATNGNLVNASSLRKELEESGSIFQTTSDTEVVAHLIARSSSACLEGAVKESLQQVTGAYAMIILTNEKMIVAKDPHSLRPLCMGRLENAYVFSSETCAFDTTGATYVRDIHPGELLTVTEEEVISTAVFEEVSPRICSFEYVYFARPDSNIEGVNVHAARKRLGCQLAKEAPINADVVTGVPDSSISSAIGFAETTGIPFELGLIKNRYVGRTFIQPNQELREQGVKMKLSAVHGVVKGKRVVMVDDSIVRGTTCRRIVNMLKEAGASEVHVRISSPPVKNPCFYGIDTPDHEQLVAHRRSIEEIRQVIHADSLAFISVEGLIEAIGRTEEGERRGHCLACFTGQYPTIIKKEEKVLEEVK